jgi:L-2-hydroxyglutarate oxidase LhgO
VSESVDSVVIGAGVVGLAIARSLALAGREVVVLEAADQIGTGISSRHSEVIHAGLYYATGSLKARLCVQGRQQLYAYCTARGVPFRQTGKLIVATDETQHPALRAIAERGRANGVHDLQWLEAHEAMAIEPALSCTGALLSPSTGIIDSHGMMAALHADAESAGAMFAFRTPFEGATVTGDGHVVHAGGEEPIDLHCRVLVNCAGLSAPRRRVLRQGASLLARPAR